MKEYVEGLEREFSAIERGFLREQRRARSDYASFDPEQARRVAFLAYRSEVYQVRMYAVFRLFAFWGVGGGVGMGSGPAR